MAPFRTSARTNRSGRLQAENDVFEGLPVRQWRQSEGTFGLPPPDVIEQDKDLIFPELPMPRDSHLLAPWTQQLLREARKPRTAKRKAEPAEEVKVEEDEDPKERQNHSGWSAKKWSQMPRQLEEPEPEYLAKRRKGLSSSYSEAPAFIPQIATRTAKVRKFDAAGQQIVYEVIVPEGQAIEGEVKDEDISMLDAPSLAPGTVVEGVGVANSEGQVVANDLLQPTPQRRRKPPPPKRKGGPGRGKKKVMFQRPLAGEGVPGADAGTTTTASDGTNPSASTLQGADATGTPAEGDEDDGDEGEGEEGEEGEEGDDDDREEGELSDGEIPGPPTSVPGTDVPPPTDGALASDVPMLDAEQPPPVNEIAHSDSTAMPPPPIPSLATPAGLVEPAPTPVETTKLSVPTLPSPETIDASDLPIPHSTEINPADRPTFPPEAQQNAPPAVQPNAQSDAQPDTKNATPPTEPTTIPGLELQAVAQTTSAPADTIPHQHDNDAINASEPIVPLTEAVATAAIAAKDDADSYEPPVEASAPEVKVAEATTVEEPSAAPAADPVPVVTPEVEAQAGAIDIPAPEEGLDIPQPNTAVDAPSTDIVTDITIPDAPPAESVSAIADLPDAAVAEQALQPLASAKASAETIAEQLADTPAVEQPAALRPEISASAVVEQLDVPETQVDTAPAPTAAPEQTPAIPEVAEQSSQPEPPAESS
ncbi:hypothetical protein K461DRAFT_40134 [Myriangium duriaei CBS 260.36]|uniref:Uncharacterized protein n=1 Tax=Myriangium duriaei CBS 260.36 TaxID=1168546 RepID=A0A9P4IUW5_9PEZI|nr:hypothetical protein K461DRAFT_40134 [Myriangium duriaei CBS 260.36]